MQSRLLFILWLIMATAAQAQEQKKAYKYYNEAMAYKAKKDIGNACNQMELAIKEDASYADAYSALGQWYYDQHQFEKSSSLFRKAIVSCKDGRKAFAKPYIKCLLASGKADSALQMLESYMPAKDYSEWQKLKEQALAQRQLQQHAWDEPAYNMGPRINTSSPEMFPSLSADSQTFYFTRRTNNMDEDFYVARPDSCGGWFYAQNMGAPPNTPDQESAQMISADGHYLFFTRCDIRSQNGWGLGGCDLYMCYRSDSIWSAPESFGSTINTPDYEGMPCLSADNRELFFTSNRPGGYGGFDLWVSKFEYGSWGAPINLGPEINTPGNETAPCLHIDNKTLYFSSDGHKGMGGKDLYMSKRISDTIWSKPVNMGVPVNSPVDENSCYVSFDGKKLFFSSDRDHDAGNSDLYQMKLPVPLQPVAVTRIKGYVYDSISKVRLNSASIYVKDAMGNKLYHFNSNRGDGSYLIPLPVGQSYIFETGRVGYQTRTGEAFFNEQFLANAFEFNIPLLPLDYISPINDSLVLTLPFALNTTTLTEQDIALVNNAVRPFLNEKGIVVMVNGYTDNTGTPIINEQLSYKRAQAVAQQLESLGLDENMIKAQGWGEVKTIASNDTEEGRNKNRRVEIVISR